ncbi:MAG: flagellar hook-basal body complex protein FliE [Peptococcaceae bacterium]|nr:flagellar hook-basal body complex protein FliE [Peptococcaceae bacterium]
MSNSINPLSPLTPLKPLHNNNAVQNNALGTAGADFSSILQKAITKLENTQQEANQAALDLVTGNIEDFHTPVIAMEKAALTMGLAVNIRNKVLEAYHEIMRMQI